MRRIKLTDAINYNDVMLGISQFLDDFKNADNKYELIKDEPMGDCENKIAKSLMAAIAHKLANDNNIVTPEWVHKSIYIMPQPTYILNTKNPDYQKLLRETSFPEFISRNLYYGDNVLNRY